MNEPLLIGIVVVCLLFSAYFSATETAFSTFNKIKMRNLADKGNRKAKLVLNISENYDTMLSSILIGNNIVNILSASLATILFISWIGDKSGPTVSTLVMTLIVLIFGEITPKTLAKQIPDKFAMFAAPFLKLLMIIFFVFTFIFKKWQDLISKLVKSKDEDIVTEEEILTLVEEAAEEVAEEAKKGRTYNGKYEVYGKSDIKVRNSKIEYLTNGLFVWDSVARDFICSGCRRLKSLEGAPRKVGDSFDISGCIELESLKGGPEKVGYNFSCSSCSSRCRT